MYTCSDLNNFKTEIPISNCDVINDYEIIKPILSGPTSLVYKVTKLSDYVLKIIPAYAPGLVEMMIGCQLGKLVSYNISKSYLTPIGWNKCDSFPEGKTPPIFKTLSKGISYYMIIPWANYTLSTSKDIMSEYDLICMLFELLYALVVARYYFQGFAHNDLKAANIFIFKTDKYRTYQLNDTKFYLQNNLLSTMGDFGQSYAKIINDELYDYPPKNKGRNDVAMLITSFIESLPKSSLIGQLKNLRAVLIEDDQGYQDYTTIIKILSTHSIFDRLKTKELVKGDNIITMLPWKEAIGK